MRSQSRFSKHIGHYLQFCKMILPSDHLIGVENTVALGKFLTIFPDTAHCECSIIDNCRSSLRDGLELTIFLVFNCDPLASAVLHQNETKLRQLLHQSKAKFRQPEKTTGGLNVLHLAVRWPQGLSILLDEIPSPMLPALLNGKDITDLPPIIHALEYSGEICTTRPNTTMCDSDCRCSYSASLLLESGCVLFFHYPSFRFKAASLKCTLEVVRHLGSRRQRLKQLAMSKLPKAQIPALGLKGNQLPDDGVARLLVEQLDKLRVPIPPDLGVGPSLEALEGFPDINSVYD